MSEKVRKVLLEGIAVLSLILLFTFLAVYDSEKMPFKFRFLYWGSLISIGWLFASLVRPWVFHRVLPRRPIWLKLIVLSLIVALPIPLVLLGFDTGYEQGWLISNWVRQYCLSFVIVSAFMTGRYLVVRSDERISSAPEHVVDIDQSTTAKFLKRLPAKFHGAVLYAVSAEDHYLRVYTDRGSELIHMRLADAIHELSGSGGFQTHRSWWVAQDGISQIERQNGKHIILLKSGALAPIARSRFKEIRASLAAQEA